jgi:hypothetical protein
MSRIDSASVPISSFDEKVSSSRKPPRATAWA